MREKTDLIRGIAWDHKRCWGPLDASVNRYANVVGDVTVEWDRRSLFSFGEGDLAEFTDRYDLVIYDHPFVGDIRAQGLMLDLAPYLSAQEIAAFEADSVGRSWQSYESGGGIWALPIDAAAQTAAWRPDLMEPHGFEVPQTLEEVFALARATRSKDLWVAWPAKPTDLACTMMSIAASLGIEPGEAPDQFMAPADIRQVVGLLRELGGLVHPGSLAWNPIHCFDFMSSEDDVVYIPYGFNYANYAANTERRLRFGISPRADASLPTRALLGGAGIGVSAGTQNPEQAIAYAKYLCSPEVQSTYYLDEGGQPASRQAWLAAADKPELGGFFTDTLTAIDQAWLRPTGAGFVPFFHGMTEDLFNVVFEGGDVEGFTERLNAGFATLAKTAEGQIAS